MIRNRTSCWILAVIALLSPACRKKVAPAPPPPPAAIIIPKTEPVKIDPTLPPAPKIVTQTPPAQPPVKVEVKQLPPKPVPQKKVRARAGKKGTDQPKTGEVKTAEAKIDPSAPDAPQTSPATGATPTLPAGPQLGQILTPEETREYAKRLDTALERAKSSLVIIQGKVLNKEQKDGAERVKTFVAQAEQAREQDLVSAVSLAERADLLSRDLLERIR